MVKFSPALLVFTTLALSVFASPIEHRDIPGVEAALRQIGTDITNLDGLVNGLKAPLPMHDALVDTISLHRLDPGCSDQGIGTQNMG